jgi:hypothetical protein
MNTRSPCVSVSLEPVVSVREVRVGLRLVAFVRDILIEGHANGSAEGLRIVKSSPDLSGRGGNR